MIKQPYAQALYKVLVFVYGFLTFLFSISKVQLSISPLLCISGASANEFSVIFFYFSPNQTQTHLDYFLDYFNVLDEL